jgi:Zn-dependent protease
LQFGTLEQTIAFALIMLISFPVHECAHAFAAHKMGDNTAADMGRLTLNPLKHLDLFGSILMLFTGFGWAKPVPINPDNFKNRKVGFAVSSLAGPLSNLLIAYFFMMLYRVAAVMTMGKTLNATGQFIIYAMSAGITVNVWLGIFNMIPIPPLDGSRVFSLFLTEKKYFTFMQYGRFSFFILILLLQLPFVSSFLQFLSERTINVLLFLTNWMKIIGY